MTISNTIRSLFKNNTHVNNKAAFAPLKSRQIDNTRRRRNNIKKMVNETMPKNNSTPLIFTYEESPTVAHVSAPISSHKYNAYKTLHNRSHANTVLHTKPILEENTIKPYHGQIPGTVTKSNISKNRRKQANQLTARKNNARHKINIKTRKNLKNAKFATHTIYNNIKNNPMSVNIQPIEYNPIIH